MPGHPNLLAASRSWLTDLAIAGWRGIDRDLVTGVDQTLAALLGQPSLRRLATLLDGFTAELAASCPGASLATVPARRWADLWSRGVLLSQPGGDPGLPGEEVSGRLLPLGVDLHEHPTAVQAQIHAVLEPADGGPARLVRASVSAPKVDTIVGVGGWQLLSPHCELLRALAGQRSVEVTGMPLRGGDLLWREECARAGAPADPFSTARVQLATASAAPVPPLTRHPVAIAEPVLIDGYAVLAEADELTLNSAGQHLVVDVERLPSAGPLTAELVASSSALLGLLRWDAGRWTVQPLAVQATVKRKTVAVHGGAWADGATDPVGKKAHAAAGDAVTVLRERAGRLLRK